MPIIWHQTNQQITRNCSDVALYHRSKFKHIYGYIPHLCSVVLVRAMNFIGRFVWLTAWSIF